MTELKPCPFCGSVDVKVHIPYFTDDCYMVQCCGYWSLYMRIGENGHTKTILDNSDLASCLVEFQERGLKRMGENRE